MKNNVFNYTYYDLPIKSDNRVHHIISNEVVKLLVNKKEAVILDIAGGTGSLSLRLLHLCNYCKLKIFVNTFGENDLDLPNVYNFKLDLNDPKFDKKIKKIVNDEIDIILAVEVIEHLKSPIVFLEDCFKLLNKNSNFFLSTPNSDSDIDRINMFLHGYPSYFGENNFTNSEGCLLNIPKWLLEHTAKNNKINFEKLPDKLTTTHVHKKFSYYIKLLLSLPLLLFAKNWNECSILIYRFKMEH